MIFHKLHKSAIYKIYKEVWLLKQFSYYAFRLFRDWEIKDFREKPQVFKGIFKTWSFVWMG